MVTADDEEEEVTIVKKSLVSCISKNKVHLLLSSRREGMKKFEINSFLKIVIK